jgi:lipopolysaccharide transport system permease protein
MSQYRNDWRWVERTFSRDVRAVFRQRSLAWQLYLADVAEQRRDAGLGLVAPFLSILVNVALLGGVMSLVFREPISTFIPFFAISLSLWQSVSTFTANAAQANDKTARYISFPEVSGYIIHLVMCYEFMTSLALKIAASLLIVALLNFGILTRVNLAGFVVGLVLLCSALMSWSLPTAYFFDRFRLLRGFLPQLLFAVYLITPILWDPARIQAHRWVVDFNPVFHMIEAARAPLLSGSWPLMSYLVVIGLILLGTATSWALFQPNRDLVVYRWIV